MDVLSIIGSAPGPLVATVSHGGEILTVRMNVARHPDGGWHVRKPCGGWGPRCHAVPAAILMEASEVLEGELVALAA
jgi:hypothetical protein